MITHIKITDFATIENTEINFHKGLNVITGETGAGKSIVIEAISLALGSRADNTFVRTGAEKAIVQMVAEVDNRDVVITRELSSAGKNLCKIDGQIVSLGELSKLCSRIADIHGQYDHQSLLIPENHIKLIDSYEKESINPAKVKVFDLYEEYKEACKKHQELELLSVDNERKKEFMEFEIDEIAKATLTLGEDARLQDELLILQNKEKIYGTLDKTYNVSHGGDNPSIDAIGRVITTLREITTVSKEASAIEDEFSDIYYRFDDVCTRLREARDKCVYSPSELDEINDRLHFINDLKRKYGDTIDAILEHAETQKKLLYSLKTMDTELESLFLEKVRLKEMLEDETNRLTALRKASAMTLQSKIQEELEKLNFHDVQVSINFVLSENLSPKGRDKVEFLISTNKGEALKPLYKIASGGEMSRIMLAFKKIIGEYDGIPTMIFDEIDSGISGEAAVTVGKAMSALSDNHQVISITHLPQIAACADHNYRIEKTSDDKGTYTTVSHLSDH
ncbi:MAG: DNA repair protein RecN, partial [Anaerovoracaceae bacterium]